MWIHMRQLSCHYCFHYLPRMHFLVDAAGFLTESIVFVPVVLYCHSAVTLSDVPSLLPVLFSLSSFSDVVMFHSNCHPSLHIDLSRILRMPCFCVRHDVSIDHLLGSCAIVSSIHCCAMVANLSLLLFLYW